MEHFFELFVGQRDYRRAPMRAAVRILKAIQFLNKGLHLRDAQGVAGFDRRQRCQRDGGRGCRPVEIGTLERSGSCLYFWGEFDPLSDLKTGERQPGGRVRDPGHEKTDQNQKYARQGKNSR